MARVYKSTAELRTKQQRCVQHHTHAHSVLHLLANPQCLLIRRSLIACLYVRLAIFGLLHLVLVAVCVILLLLLLILLLILVIFIQV